MKKTTVDSLINDALIFIQLLTAPKKVMTSYKAAKIVFDVRDKYDLKKSEVTMRYFFEKWHKLGVIKKEVEDNKVFYYIDEDKIIFDEAILIIGDKYFPMGKILGLNINNSWIFIQLEGIKIEEK